MNSILKIETLSLSVHLGLTQEERNTPQKIEIDYSISSDSLYKACITDEITDTICYWEISEQIKKHIELKEFKLIEFVTYEVYKIIKAKIGVNDKVSVKISKNPPIDYVLGAASFVIND